MSLSLFYPGIHPRHLSYPAREGGMGNGWGGGVFPVEKSRAGKRLRKKKRSMFERSELKRFPLTRRPARKTAFHRGVLFAPLFPTREKVGDCQGKQITLFKKGRNEYNYLVAGRLRLGKDIESSIERREP